MQFSIIAILSFAVAAIATPTTGQYVQARSALPLRLRNVEEATQTCGDNKVLSCCNQDTKSSADRGLLSGNFDVIMNLNCVALQAPILSTGDTKANDICGSKSEVKCCDGQKGQINAGVDCNEG